jgi:galactose mutarotase-like enzyme
MPSLGIWTKPGARYICIEPWDGMADPAGFSGEIWDKPGIARIAPGASRNYLMSLTLLPG